MGKKRIILIAIAAVVAFICLGVIGVRTFVQAIYSERGCDWANIDNIEMHARLDVPGTENCDCAFTVSDNVKRAVIQFDSDVDIQSYIGEQKLVASRDFDTGLKSVKGFAAEGELFVRSGNGYDSDYSVALDPKTRKLWVYIRYKR